MINLWNQIRGDLIWDGSLRDIYIKGTTLDNWNQFLGFIRETTQYQYRIDSELAILPTGAVDIFSVQEHSKLLSIWVEGIQLNCHFFDEREIELDLDPREVTSEERFDALRQFMKQLATALERSIILTPENRDQYPIAKYELESQSWQYFPTAET